MTPDSLFGGRTRRQDEFVVHLPQQLASWVPRLKTSRRAHRLTWIAVVAAACIASAWSARIAQPTSSNLMFLDVSVGLIFVAAAAASRGPASQRAWFVAVGLAGPPGVLAPARSLHGRAGVVLSQYLEPRYAPRLLADQPGHLGYLLKESVSPTSPS